MKDNHKISQVKVQAQDRCLFSRIRERGVNLLYKRSGSQTHYTRLGLLSVYVLAAWWVSLANSQLGASEPPPKTEIVIVMDSYVYAPSELMLQKGQSVTFVLRNESFLVPHNFLLDDPDGIRVVDRDISSGESERLSVTLEKSGTYHFYCDKQLLFFPTHRDQGMEGRLIVR